MTNVMKYLFLLEAKINIIALYQYLDIFHSIYIYYLCGIIDKENYDNNWRT